MKTTTAFYSMIKQCQVQQNFDCYIFCCNPKGKVYKWNQYYYYYNLPNIRVGQIPIKKKFVALALRN